MNRWIAITALALMIAAPEAIAQTTRGGPNPAGPGVTTQLPQAPVGHRQPRRGDVPNESLKPDPNDPVTREDAELNRKLRSICRGC